MEINTDTFLCRSGILMYFAGAYIAVYAMLRKSYSSASRDLTADRA